MSVHDVKDEEVGFELIKPGNSWLYQKGGWTVTVSGETGEVAVTGEGSRKVLSRIMEHAFSRILADAAKVYTQMFEILKPNPRNEKTD